MGGLLNSGYTKAFFERIRKSRLKFGEKWNGLGFINDTLSNTTDNPTQLFCCKASTLLIEEETGLNIEDLKDNIMPNISGTPKA
jgi:hypothetical protein